PRLESAGGGRGTGGTTASPLGAAGAGPGGAGSRVKLPPRGAASSALGAPAAPAHAGPRVPDTARRSPTFRWERAGRGRGGGGVGGGSGRPARLGSACGRGGGGGPGDAAGGRAGCGRAAAASEEPVGALTAPAGGGAPAEGAAPPGPRGHLLAEPGRRHPPGPPPPPAWPCGAPRRRGGRGAAPRPGPDRPACPRGRRRPGLRSQTPLAGLPPPPLGRAPLSTSPW
ncbi:hypothetical protein P7K49_014857, partial [Saguinus oedipus]